jgi:hypothetical protein
MRDNNEQSTVQDKIDFDTFLAPDNGSDDLAGHPAEPAAVPNHGRRPRLKRPSEAVHRRDSLNTCKSDVDIHRMAMANAAREDNRFSKSREIAKQLMIQARYHAPKLSWKTDDAIREALEFPDGIMFAARYIAKPLPVDAKAGLMAKFVEEIWTEIRRLQKNRRCH